MLYLTTESNNNNKRCSGIISTTFSVSKAIINGFLFYSPKRKKRTETFPLASPICLPFSAFTSHVAGDMHDGEGERRWYQVTEWDKQQFLSPSGRPRGDGEFLMVFSFCCTADISCTLSGLVEHLHPLNSEKQKRGLPPAGDCVGQSCKPNMPWFMEPSFPGLPLWPQCGGFMVPCPRCCFCFCCINSCSKAEGPGCIMELDQIDWKTAQSLSAEVKCLVVFKGFVFQSQPNIKACMPQDSQTLKNPSY